MRQQRVRTSLGLAELHLTYRRRREPLMVNVIVRRESRRKYAPSVLFVFYTFARQRSGWVLDGGVFQRDGKDVEPPLGVIQELAAVAARWAERSPSLRNHVIPNTKAAMRKAQKSCKMVCEV